MSEKSANILFAEGIAGIITILIVIFIGIAFIRSCTPDHPYDKMDKYLVVTKAKGSCVGQIMKYKFGGQVYRFTYVDHNESPPKAKSIDFDFEDILTLLDHTNTEYREMAVKMADEWNEAAGRGNK